MAWWKISARYQYRQVAVSVLVVVVVVVVVYIFYNWTTVCKDRIFPELSSSNASESTGWCGLKAGGNMSPLTYEAAAEKPG